MKKIIFTTFGSLGDLHPLMGLATTLKDEGHRPIICASKFYKDYVQKAGLEFHPIHPHINHKDKNIISAVLDTRNGPELLHKEYIFPYLQESIDDLLEIAKDADLIVGSVLTYYVPIVSHLTKTPWLNIIIAPISMWSGYDPPILAPLPFLGKLRFLPAWFHHWILKQLFKVSASWAKPLEKIRTKYGMENKYNPFWEGLYQGNKTICLWSQHFYPKQIDWPQNAITTGFIFYDPAQDIPISDEVLSFSGKHKKIAIFTLGSTTIQDSDDFLDIFIEYAKTFEGGCIITCGDNIDKYRHLNSDRLLMINYAPYSKLFALGSIIIHQGGIGTTAQCFKAGKPQIVLPFCMDQFDNGYRVQRLGCGSVLEKSVLTAKRLDNKIIQVLNDHSIMLNCKNYEEKINQEDSMAHTVSQILTACS